MGEYKQKGKRMDMDNAFSSQQAQNIVEHETVIVNSTKENEVKETPEHPIPYLLEKFSQVISEIYKEMGIGKYIDYSA